MVSRRPKAERAKLAAMAVTGILLYQVILVGPFVLLMALNPWAGYYGAWPYVAAAIFFVWVLHPSHSVPGSELPPNQAPELFTALNQLADRMGAPRVHEVRLFDEYNAAAVEAAWPWQPWRKRRILVLGVPLLATNSTRTVLSVVAHELGHFSHRHGRLGHWIYRTRAEWDLYAKEPLEDSSLLERGASAFAHWFAPRFSRLAFDHSRHCEYEADACGAAAVGSSSMADALLNIAVLGRRWTSLEEELMSERIVQDEQAPARWLPVLQARVQSRPLTPDELARLFAEKTDPHDTHPRTLDRVEALGVATATALGALGLPREVAGAVWLPNWTEVIEAHDRQWRTRCARGWHLEHVRHRRQRERLAQLESAGERGIKRALLELEHGQPAVAEGLAFALCGSGASANAEALYVLGASRLKMGHVQGVDALEDCIKADPRWAAPARRLLARHKVLMNDQQADRNRKLWDRAETKRAMVRGQALDRLQQGRVSVATLDADAWSILRAGWAGVDVVAGAWCAGIEALEHDGRTYPVVILVLRLKTAELLARGWTEDEFRDDATHLLDGVVPEPAIKLVWTTYTTEALAPELDALLTRWAAARDPGCLVVPQPGESVGAGVRAAALR